APVAARVRDRAGARDGAGVPRAARRGAPRGDAADDRALLDRNDPRRRPHRAAGAPLDPEAGYDLRRPRAAADADLLARRDPHARLRHRRGHGPVHHPQRVSVPAAPGDAPVMVLGYDFWRRHFAGDPSVVGRAVRVNGRPLTIVGVAAEGFHSTESLLDISAYVPVSMVAALGGTDVSPTQPSFFEN